MNVDDDPHAVLSMMVTPPASFVAERNRLVKELRASGDGDTSAAVAKLRRPGVADWALNMTAAEQPDAVADLADAAAAMAAAQEAAMAGHDAGDVQRGDAAHCASRCRGWPRWRRRSRPGRARRASGSSAAEHRRPRRPARRRAGGDGVAAPRPARCGGHRARRSLRRRLRRRRRGHRKARPGPPSRRRGRSGRAGEPISQPAAPGRRRAGGRGGPRPRRLAERAAGEAALAAAERSVTKREAAVSPRHAGWCWRRSSGSTALERRPRRGSGELVVGRATA